jgi:hypothetical protein
MKQSIFLEVAMKMDCFAPLAIDEAGAWWLLMVMLREG